MIRPIISRIISKRWLGPKLRRDDLLKLKSAREGKCVFGNRTDMVSDVQKIGKIGIRVTPTCRKAE